MFNSNDFKKFANSNGVNSLTLHDYQNFQSKANLPTNMTPYIYEQSDKRGTLMDVFSRLMMDGTIFLNTEVEESMSSIIIAQLLYLDNQDKDEIGIYIASPGGSVYHGYGIIDTMNFIKADVSTTNVSMAASMGAMILSCGTKGKRSALPHSRTMIHQPLGGAQGQASDIEITAREIQAIKKELYQMLVDNTGKSYKQIEKDADRDYWMKATEAKEYGIIDNVIEKR